VDSYGRTKYLTIVFAALAGSRRIELQARPHTIIAADPCPPTSE
jgi:hypothetical protein